MSVWVNKLSEWLSEWVSEWVKTENNLSMIYFVLLIYLFLQLVCSQDIITTIAGTGSASYSGDGAAATSATLNTPYGVGLDSSGSKYYFLTL